VKYHLSENQFSSRQKLDLTYNIVEIFLISIIHKSGGLGAEDATRYLIAKSKIFPKSQRARGSV
jgi:hypothetical protein